MRSKLILGLIILAGLLLRVVNIGSNPPSLYGDELTMALDSYSLLNSGHDQLGNFLPLTFPMGAGRPAGYVYGSIPFVAVFGPAAMGVRALSILSGTGLIILLYLVGKRLFSQKLGLLAAAIGAVSPWDIALSRGGFEAHSALFLSLLGIYLFFKAKEKPVFYLFSALSFGLTFHTYPTYKVSLLFFLPLLLWYRGKVLQSRKYFFIGAGILLILGVLSLSQTFTAGSEKRFSDINIFSQGKLKDSIEQKINFERQITEVPKPLSRYFHNKPVEYAKVFIENYLQNFSIDFLVLHGDRNPRHNMATMGGIYFVELLLIFIGLIAFWHKEKRTVLFLVCWLFLAPIPTATVDLPHALRSSFMLPPLVILSALGLLTILNYRNRAVLFLFSLAFIIQFVFFIQKLFFLSPNEYSNFWSYPAKLASEIAKENKDKYSYIILSDKINDIEFAYPVYAKVGSSVIFSQNKSKSLLLDLTFKKFDNVYIGFIPDSGIENFIQSLEGSVLFIGNPGIEDKLAVFETVKGRDGQTALTLRKREN